MTIHSYDSNDVVSTKAIIKIAQQWFYRYKILNFFWFDGKLPSTLEQKFLCFINPDWPENINLPQSIQGILDLDEAELAFICQRIKQPEWTQKKTVLEEQITLKSMFTGR